jgi:uncharacterized OB-fold protein
MSHSPQTERSPLPQPDARSAPYWRSLADSQLLLLECDVCRARNHPNATTCRLCVSGRLDWKPVPPSGRLFSWAIELRAVIPGMQPPYVIAQVTPDGCDDGGVRLAGTLLVEDPSVLQIDLPVRLVFTPAPGSDVTLLRFVLA